MMTTTHAFVGAGIGLAVAWVDPSLAPAALAVGAAGGALPDADMVAVHRRSLHFPVGYALLASLISALAVVTQTRLTVLPAMGLVAAAVHCAMDVFGGGVEPRPWEATSTRGVYNHLTGRWIYPRRWVRYAGAPEDFALAVVASLPLLALSEGPVLGLTIVLLAASAAFTVSRRRFAGLSERLVE